MLSNGEKIAFWSLLVAVIAIPASIFQKEIRVALGADPNSFPSPSPKFIVSSSPSPSFTSSPKQSPTPSPTATTKTSPSTTPVSNTPTPKPSPTPIPPTPPVKQTPTPAVAPPRSVVSTWSGEWTANGDHLSFEMNINITGDVVEGAIVWRLVSTPRKDMQSRIGEQATEYIRGTYDRNSTSFTFRGYKEDDPKNLIVSEKYQLDLSPDGNTLTGKTYNLGAWNGRFTARRK